MTDDDMRELQKAAEMEGVDQFLALRKDARRYQYLRAQLTGTLTLLGAPAIGLSGVSGDDMDAAIDAAMGAS
jgi:predicted metal-dependent peptidase